MTDLQSEIYRDAMARSRMVVSTLSDDAINDDDALDEADGVKPKIKRGKKAEEKTKMASSGSHILMDLRKAASHPLLFRTHYTRPKIEKLARQMMKMPEWCDSTFSYLVEDLEVLPDYQIHNICEAHNVSLPYIVLTVATAHIMPRCRAVPCVWQGQCTATAHREMPEGRHKNAIVLSGTFPS